MGNIIEIDSIHDPRVAAFASLTDTDLRRSHDIFIAESPKVIRTAVGAGYIPEAMLCERRHIDGDAADIIGMFDTMPVYTGSREVLSSLTGYTLTRGVLCAMRRPAHRPAEEVLANARRVAVLDDVCDATNIGAIFRSAAALGIDAVVLGPTACDPLNRRAVRVSMGSVFLIPWIKADDWQATLGSLGFKTVAMALKPDSVDLTDPRLAAEPRLAIVLGGEGYGLPKEAIARCDYTVCIPMARGVDSLNVAAAAAIAFWQLTR